MTWGDDTSRGITQIVEERTSLYELLTTNDGAGIDLGALATALLGMIAGSFFGGLAAFIESFFQTWLISPLLGLAEWLNMAISTLGFSLANIGYTAWSQSVAFSFAVGLFAPIFAFGMYLAMARIVVWLREEVSS